MTEFDPGPPSTFAGHFDQLPDISAKKDLFWFSWGPVFYRGRLDGSARVIAVASDPGPTERLVGRTLVGDAGQRVQGFLTKLGLTRSYVLVNAHPHALHPSRGSHGLTLLGSHATMRTWRNDLYSMLKTSSVEAIIAFGGQAQRAVELWPGKGTLPVFEVPHPSSRNPAVLANEWRAAIPQLRAIVTPDPGGSNTGPNYGPQVAEEDYSPIPKRDLPWGLPSFVGDDRWGRLGNPKHNNSVARGADNSLIWIAPGE